MADAQRDHGGMGMAWQATWGNSVVTFAEFDEAQLGKKD